MIRLLFGAALVALGLTTIPAYAQSSKIFLSSTGADTNDGSRGSPKRTLQAGHNAVAARGELIILDTAGYGALNITKSVAVTVPPGVNGFINASGSSNAITINAGPNDIVSLQGLILGGGGASASGNGIYATSVGTLMVEDTTVRNFAHGVYLKPTTSASLLVRGGALHDNSVAGIILQSLSSGVSIKAIVSGIAVDGSSIGLEVDSANGGIARLTANRSVIFNNNIGIQISDRFSAIVVDECVVNGNGTAFAKVSNAGNLWTRGNNTVYDNVNIVNGQNSLDPLASY
jgi:hypothetical protein